MEPRVSIITLGVGDLDRAVAFYEAMGLSRNQTVTDGVAFFQVFDAAKASYEVSNLHQAIITLNITNIRSVMGSMDLW